MVELHKGEVITLYLYNYKKAVVFQSIMVYNTDVMKKAYIESL